MEAIRISFWSWAILFGDDGSEALRAVAAYNDLNPIRAGLVQVPEGYRWCSYAAAVAGNRGARQALTYAAAGRLRVAWRKVDVRCGGRSGGICEYCGI
ncbi:MAG: hypothetical protein L3J39_18835 [Verrucomicrobiales bacterium]|nr:hypothetical protein [Verrucomicrobiales bacterium]